MKKKSAKSMTYKTVKREHIPRLQKTGSLKKALSNHTILCFRASGRLRSLSIAIEMTRNTASIALYIAKVFLIPSEDSISRTMSEPNDPPVQLMSIQNYYHGGTWTYRESFLLRPFLLSTPCISGTTEKEVRPTWNVRYMFDTKRTIGKFINLPSTDTLKR